MFRISGLSFEFRTGLFFGFFALVLSLITGIVSGIGFGTILLRVLFALPLFILVGYVAIWVFKKYVPEFYEALLLIKKRDKEDSGSQESDEGTDSFGDESDINSRDIGDENEGEDSQVLGDSKLDDTLGSDLESGKMGKHVVVDSNQFEGYEPSLMAEAVRTMMSKDED